MLELVDITISAARDLDKNEALFLPSECVIARSNTGKLRFGSGNIEPRWLQGDGEELLREHLTVMLDARQTGYFASRYRSELRIPATLRPVKVADVGRRSFHVEHEPSEDAWTAMMGLDHCEWFECEGRPYGAAECWTSDGRHLWVTPTGEMREIAEAVAA